MEKRVEFLGRVEDLRGLIEDLGKQGFAVRNVGADASRTYVYLDPSETKDPGSVVASWVNRPAPSSIKRERTPESTRVIVMTLCNRPNYVRRVFKALSECVGISDYIIIPMVEPVNKEVIELAHNIDFAEGRPVVNPSQYGPHRNTYEAFKRGFEIADFVILVQEDDELAPDALSFFEYCRQKYRDAEDVFSVNAYALVKEAWRPPPEKYHRLCRRRHFMSFTAATWRSRWEEPGGMKDNWDFKQGWDIMIDGRFRKGRWEIHPCLPRVQNIGAEGGLYTPNAEWHRRTVHNEFWSGDPRIRDEMIAAAKAAAPWYE
jgi:hypothetical protein